MLHSSTLRLSLILIVLTISGLVRAQDIRQERVRFTAGESGATIEDRIRGYETVDYVLGASGGQRISIFFESSNLAGYFNLLPPGSETALHVGSTDGNEYDGVLPRNGDYRIRVYLMRSAARRDETANYVLDVDIDGGRPEAARDPDFADGLSGGPDFWEVTDVPRNDTLNVRSGPGTGNRVVGELANGDTVRNLGCEMVGSSRWCEIEAGLDMKFTGWVNGRYLREASVYPQQ